MSLNFDFRKCDINKDKLWVEVDDGFGGKYKDTAPIPKSVVFMTLAIGMPLITEKNYKEFWRRTDIHQRLYGGLFKIANQKENRWDDLLLTQDDIIHYIGLRTNAPSKTKQKFQMELGN